MFQEAFNVQGVVPNNEAIVGRVRVTYGTNAALIFFFGMIVNDLLSMTSKFKYIYLSGHVAFYMAAMIAVIFKVAGFADWEAVLWGSIAQGLIVTVSPALVQPFMKRVTGTDDVALGYTGGAGIALSGRVATVTRSKKHPSKSTEDLNLPSGLGFLRDTTVITALSMGLIYLIVALFAGSGYIEDNLSDGTNYIVFALMQGATFSAGVFIILAGVRVVLGEIVPAFKGISERLVKDAKPALDVPITFTFAPNAVLIGFLSSFVGGLLGMGIMAMAGTTIVVPGVIAHFMTGGASGVIGNGVGGRRGAVLGAFVNGLAITFSAAVAAACPRRRGTVGLDVLGRRLRCGGSVPRLSEPGWWPDGHHHRPGRCDARDLRGVVHDRTAGEEGGSGGWCRRGVGGAFGNCDVVLSSASAGNACLPATDVSSVAGALSSVARRAGSSTLS